MRFLAAALFAAALAGTAYAQEEVQGTLKPGGTITGRLRHVETRHPNGKLLHAYQIVSDAPKELAAKDEFCDGPPRTFHLVAGTPKEAAPLKRQLGKKVSVHIDDVMCSQTAWHIGDAVVFKWRLTQPPR